MANDAAASRGRARNAELSMTRQVYSEDPLADRDSDHFRKEYVMTFVEKWDELIDWRGRAESEGQFFIDILRARGKETRARRRLRHRLSFRPADRGRL